MSNLHDGLNEEISRNEELLRAYREIPQGIYGAAFIENDLKFAKKARSEGDCIKMMQAYEKLEGNQ